MNWSVETLNAEVDSEIEALPPDMRAKIARIGFLIMENGLHKVHEPYVKHIQGKLWEMRVTGRAGIARTLYVTATGRRVVILRAFIKKTQKTPRAEIELALNRAKEIQ